MIRFMFLKDALAAGIRLEWSESPWETGWEAPGDPGQMMAVVGQWWGGDGKRNPGSG